MKHLITIYILIIISHLPSILTGQSLLTNGGFEEYLQCPPTENAGDPYINGYLLDWYQSLGGRMKHEDCYIGDNDFWYYITTDSLNAYAGKGFTSGVFFSDRPRIGFRNARCYLTAPLTEPMLADSTYRVSYYLHCNRNYALIDHFGATFVQDTADLFTVQDSNGMALYTDDYVGYKDTYLGPDDQWHHIEGCYTAKGGERWIALGHFLPFDEVNWHPTYEASLASSAALFNVDEVSVKLATRKKEDNHQLIACDAEVVTLPRPENINVGILDIDGNEVESIQVDWPNNYTFYYQDACFGELGSIMIESEICFDQLFVEDEVCEDVLVDFDQYLVDNDLYVSTWDGQLISSFLSDEKGIYHFTIQHQKYGEVGQITIEVVNCDDCKIHLPNVLSLRNPINNKFSPTTKCTFENYEILVFDRWGNQHFQSTDPSLSWIPSSNLASGVYVYFIKYKFKHPLDIFQPQVMTGSITILK